MRIIKDNEELKSYIKDGEIVFNESIECNFDINVNANINAWDINAWRIKARDINAVDIKSWNINAWSISYHAFCVSYNNIECTSIEGRRKNSFHKCLDGELKIKEQEHIMTIEEIEQKLGITNLKIKK